MCQCAGCNHSILPDIMEQLENQKSMFKPPHLEHAMVNEAELKVGKGMKEVFVTSPMEAVGGKEVLNGMVMPDETREQGGLGL